MGILDFLFKQKDKLNSLTEKEAQIQTNLPTDEQIRSTASIGFNNTWLTGITNKNLFPMMFEWIDLDQYKKILRFKSLHSTRINYAPYVVLYCDNDEFYYNGDWTSNKITINCGSIGNVNIPYHGKCLVKVLSPHTHFDCNERLEKKQLEDYTDILEVDYSPEAIEHGENQRKRIINEEFKERERKEIDNIKDNIKDRKKKRELEKIALQELIDEGEIFPEANKRPPIPRDVVDTVWNRDGGKCVYCGSTENLHLDHIIPFSKGGDTSVENLQLLCQKCNLEKSNKIG
ncbi:HNH endonuclease [Bacteroides nordii]|jgi:hypothetical protein|uniref:HNH endonuclease n=1 Tax=Bacteroides nordii TaxID=291645 RepID=UPI00206E0021|nr:HNH endonuclease signature motif containing protein [Bacteroides nordii]DAZ20146.1 MAG TPA: HNHc [Caudoviricetes sp.]